jgi:hypothetical protein
MPAETPTWVEQPAAEPWPIDEHTIRVDEMFARQLDTEFSAGVRGLLHDPETGVSAQRGEAALEAIAGAMPALGELKERTLAQAIGPRQRSILEPLIETRLDRAAGTLGQLAQRATVEVDYQSVADRIAGLNQDAAMSWHDPAYLRKLGRTAVEELRYQGERRGWDSVQIDAKARGGLSDLYAGAVETAIRQDDLEGASALYGHAREVIDPERQTAIDRRFVRAREVAVYRDVDRDLAGIPIEPAGPPGIEVFAERAAELTPEDASDEVRARIGQVAVFAQHYAERQWNKKQAKAGIAAFDWIGKNPGRSFLAISSDIRDWLAPDQWRGLEAFYIDGRLTTDRDLFEQLDRQMIYEPDVFAGVDLDRHRLSLDDEDHARFADAQKAIAEGRSDPGLARYDQMRRGIDRAVKTQGIDADGPVAARVRAEARSELDSFEAIEGRPPVGADLDDIARRAVDARGPQAAGPQPGESAPVEAPPQQGPEAKDVFGPGPGPHVVHNDDGSVEVTAGKVPTPGGPAEATVRIDRDRLGASAEMVLPSGHRVESRRTSPDSRTWSQIDTIRDPQGAIVGTQTTTFDGTRFTQTWEPADGPAQTTGWEAGPAVGDVHLASNEAVLGLGTLGALAALPVAPVVAGAIVIGLGIFAAHKAYEHFSTPDITIAPALPADDNPPDDETGSGRRARGGHEGGNDQEPEDGSPPRPPAPKEFKRRIPGQSKREAKDDIPDWARQRGARPGVDEDGKTAAKRYLDEKYGKGNWSEKGPKSEFNQLKKFFDNAFE